MAKPFYIATAIDYTNGAPHIGHAYEKVLADVLARYHRLKGEEVFFLTGVDQHGQKVQQSAEKAGVSPAEFVGELTQRFIALWHKLEVRYDGWAATVEPQHKECVRKILQRLHDEGQLYKAKQGGHYSVRQEQFLTDKERNEAGEFGPEWGEVEYREEENYYFRLAQHKEWLLQLIDTREDLITPAFRRSELRNAVDKLNGDLCVSRPKSRLSWGIEFPFDPEFVTYVWFDALVNYISFAPGGYDPTLSEQSATFRDYWPALIVIGKDILIPAHGIYWMIMLHALGFSNADMPRLLVHGWWNISGAKMSKSLGNVVDPDVLADKYGAEALRYYLVSDMVTGNDADFLEYRLVERYNGDLANSLGNLLNRTLNMAARYCEGKLRRGASSADVHTRIALDACIALADKALFSGVMDTAIKITYDANRYIEETAPWKMVKEGKSEAVAEILYDLIERVRIVATLMSPVLPKAAHGIFDQLNWKMEPELHGKEARFSLADAEWGKLPDGHVVGKPTPLFPRIEAEAR